MAYINFKEIKEKVSIEQAMIFLGLKGLTPEDGSYRGECPVCRAGSRSLILTPEKQAFYCHASKKGGDVISLTAHLHGTSMKDAAGFLNDKLAKKSEKAAKEPKPEKSDFQALAKIVDDLVHDHPAVQALGLTAEDAERLDIGYKPKGLYRGEVVAPIRSSDGHTVAVFPLPKDFKFPKVLHFPAANIVPLKRRA